MPDGIRLTLADETDVGAVAQLAADEPTCCPVFEFNITIDRRGHAIELRIREGRSGTMRDLLGLAS